MPAPHLPRSSRGVRDAVFFIDSPSLCGFFIFFNDTATTEIYTLSLHDALPILSWASSRMRSVSNNCTAVKAIALTSDSSRRSEEHTSELQSLASLVCRLLL